MTDVNRRPVPAVDPGTRRRLDPEQMAARDRAVAKMLRQHTPYRVIASRLGCSLSSVQQAVARLRAGVQPGHPDRHVWQPPRHASRFSARQQDQQD
jgi:transposase